MTPDAKGSGRRGLSRGGPLLTPGGSRLRPGGRGGPDRPKPTEEQIKAARRRLILAWIFLLLLPILLFTDPFGFGETDREELAYSDFRDQVEAGNVERVLVVGARIEGRLEQPIRVAPPEPGEDSTRVQEFLTYLPGFGDEALLGDLRGQGVRIETEPEQEGTWVTFLVNLLPLLFLVAIIVWWFRRSSQQAGQMFSIGRSQAKLYEKREEATTFEDVAGAESAKEELQEIIQFLREPGRFHALGGEVPKGVLLVGPPGTGKTLLARAVAGEAEVPFFSITGSDFMEMLVGVGASRVRDMFRKAKESAPSIIFIDELDSIGRRRGTGIGGGHDEREQTLNQLLSELDGFEPAEEVIVMAATNRPDILDPALTRAGRFDRQVLIDLPTARDREAILKIHARDKPLADDVDLEEVAKGTPGLSGADLENLLNEAALGAARHDKDQIFREDIERARDRILMGLERRSVVVSDEERELLAYHEAGHAVVAATLPTTDPVHKVSIIPRGRAMGVTQQLPERERYVYRRNELLERVAVLLGGRTAEEIVFDTRSSGAQDDLQRATELARRMVLQFGMSERLGPMATGRHEEVFLGEEIARRREFSEETAREVDEEVKQVLKEAHDTARDTLEKHRDELDAIARRLLEVEEIEGDEILQLIGRKKEGAGGS